VWALTVGLLLSRSVLVCSTPTRRLTSVEPRRGGSEYSILVQISLVLFLRYKGCYSMTKTCPRYSTPPLIDWTSNCGMRDGREHILNGPFCAPIAHMLHTVRAL
jgi:hypothetical protein